MGNDLGKLLVKHEEDLAGAHSTCCANSAVDEHGQAILPGKVVQTVIFAFLHNHKRPRLKEKQCSIVTNSPFDILGALQKNFNTPGKIPKPVDQRPPFAVFIKESRTRIWRNLFQIPKC